MKAAAANDGDPPICVVVVDGLAAVLVRAAGWIV